MLFVRAGQAMLLIAALAITPAFASRIHRAPTSGHHAKRASSKRAHHRASVKRMHGQRTIDPARATEIQTALIQQKYLSGTPSGQWDTQTQDAMKKYQADHGWQTKLMPDSRALISLGLGPSHDHIPATSGSPATSSDSAVAAQANPEPDTLASVHTISQ